MGSYDISKMREKLIKDLDDARFIHTEGVMYTAEALAMRYGMELEKPCIAGLLHDCAKCIPDSEKLTLCGKYGISVSEAERISPHLLHSKLGEYIARDKYGVTDPEILSAIRFHTTGAPDMTMLEKIIFTADYIEPNRFRAPNLKEIRSMAFTDIDRAVCEILKDTLDFLSEKKAAIDNHTIVAYNYYRDLIDGRKEFSDGR